MCFRRFNRRNYKGDYRDELHLCREILRSGMIGRDYKEILQATRRDYSDELQVHTSHITKLNIFVIL